MKNFKRAVLLGLITGVSDAVLRVRPKQQIAHIECSPAWTDENGYQESNIMVDLIDFQPISLSCYQSDQPGMISKIEIYERYGSMYFLKESSSAYSVQQANEYLYDKHKKIPQRIPIFKRLFIKARDFLFK